MWGWLRLDIVFASRLKRARSSGEADTCWGQHFDRHVPAQARIPGSVNLAHPAGAEKRYDFIWTEASARLERHGRYSSLEPSGASPKTPDPEDVRLTVTPKPGRVALSAGP